MAGIGRGTGMTALAKYQRLEARGLWRDLPEAQRREVVVALGEASLVMTDPRSNAPLAHWSLPALIRANPGQVPAVYTPGEDAAESLELDDADMVQALETVHRAIESAKARPGRLRGTILAATLAGVLAAGVFLLPDAVIRHTASVLPPATRAAIGRIALEDMARLTGAPCVAPAGRAALDRLSARLFPGEARVDLFVVREALTGATYLPDRRVVLSESLLAEAEGPEVAAGHVLAAWSVAAADDPMIGLLTHAGLVATFRLLTSGNLPADAVAGYADTVLRRPFQPPPTEPFLARVRAAEVSSSPYAYAVDPTGETVLPLIEADPFPAGPPRPLLPDAEWVALQDICST